jgi:hypothetical protein
MSVSSSPIVLPIISHLNLKALQQTNPTADKTVLTSKFNKVISITDNSPRRAEKHSLNSKTRLS